MNKEMAMAKEISAMLAASEYPAFNELSNRERAIIYCVSDKAVELAASRMLEGDVLVPVEPTEAIIEAGENHSLNYACKGEYIYDLYKAMLSAAQDKGVDSE